MGQQNESSIKKPCENEYKGYYLNSDFYYLLDEDFWAELPLVVWWKTIRKVYVVDLGETFTSMTKNFPLFISYVVKNMFQNPTRCKNFNSESEPLQKT